MVKISYEILALNVEKLFQSGINLIDPEEINQHFQNIRNFIEACGWTIDDYTDHMMGWTHNKEN